MTNGTVLIFSTAKTAPELSRAVRAGRARRIARGLFTTDLATPLETLLPQHWTELLAHYCPGALIADRSAALARPDAQGYLFVVHDRPRPVELPGLTIVPRRGRGPLSDDVPLPRGIWLSSRPRALLENLQPSRAVKGRPRRTLRLSELHDWVARLRRTEGEARLNQFRDRAREIATELGLTQVFPKLDEIIGAVLGTREVVTEVPALAAAQRGIPYDDHRERTFKTLADYLDARAPSPRPIVEADRARLKFLPFFEAYFSNFIEGTEFTVAEAASIVFDGQVPAERPADAHDVLGTYSVVADKEEMKKRPRTPEQLVELLQARHARSLGGRPERRPGQFKVRANRAGTTEFVAPDLVPGTLHFGFGLLDQLEDPFARAVFMMFLVSEVHPFDDGNGRVARVMMNVELESADEHRILIPTVYRSEYLSGLRALTHNRQPAPLVRVLDFAQRYTAQLDCTTFESGRAMLSATNAFVDPSESLERGIRLTLPSAVQR